MQELYHTIGVINSGLFLLSMLGFLQQFRLLRQKLRENKEPGSKASDSLSLNRFFVAFLAFYSFFFYGFSVDPFNHYLVWPRLIGLLIALSILRLFANDRGDRKSKVCFRVALSLFTVALVFFVIGPRLQAESQLISTSICLACSLLLLQAYVAQWRLYASKASVGATAWQYHLFTALKDFSTALLGLSMGLSEGWPIIVLAVVSVGNQFSVLYAIRCYKIKPSADTTHSALNQL